MLDPKTEVEKDEIYNIEKIRLLFKPSFVY